MELTEPLDAAEVFEQARRPATADIVLSNRKGGPEEGVIDVVEARAPNGFDDIEKVVSHEHRQAIVRGYASLAGYARDQVNARSAGAGGRRALQAIRRSIS